MAAGEQFFLDSKGWTIVEWTPPSPDAQPRIPAAAFQRGSTLLVGIHQAPSNGVFNLNWLDATNCTCTISGLQYDDDAGTLKGEVNVNFAGQDVLCQVEISMDGMEPARVMKGVLRLMDGTPTYTETTAGTFKAQASSEPPIGHDGTEDRS